MTGVAKITKVYANKVWIETDILGDAYIMLQSEFPGSERACVATVHGGYPWVDNSTRDRVAGGIARMFGASGDVEFRFREAHPGEPNITQESQSNG